MATLDAIFIGGCWDGKEFVIPAHMPEFRVAVIENFHWVSKKAMEEGNKSTVNYKIAVYKHIVNEIYWFSGIENGQN